MLLKQNLTQSYSIGLGGTPNTQCRDKPRNKTVPLLSKNLTFSISEGPAPRSTWAIGVPTPNQAGQGGALKRFVLRNADVWISYIYIYSMICMYCNRDSPMKKIRFHHPKWWYNPIAAPVAPDLKSQKFQDHFSGSRMPCRYPSPRRFCTFLGDVESTWHPCLIPYNCPNL